MKNTNLTLPGNKGEGEKKRGGATSFVKLIAMHDAKLNHVRVTCIWIQGAENTSVDAAVGIDHCLKVFDYGGARVKLSNHTTDAGGGGTRRNLMLKLGEVNRVKNMEMYIHSTCVLPGLNICLSTPTTKTMGDGGLLKRNALQLLYTAYNFSQQYEACEWADIWTLLTGVPSVNVKCPVMTRWRCVGEAVENITKYHEEWLIVSKI